MKIGDRVYITEEVKLFGHIFEAGHQFTIISSSERGWDLQDDDGNKMCETRFMNGQIKSISESREYKINIILDDKKI